MTSKNKIPAIKTETKEDKIMTYKYYYGKWLKNGQVNKNICG
jgi:hypothetical protein